MANYKEDRPWGSFEILKQIQLTEGDSCVKIISVKPRAKLSYQSHKLRAEYWTFIKGQGVVVLEGKEYPVRAGGRIDVPIGAKHRVINLDENLELIFVEVTTGHFDEKDIERFEDDYGRA